MSDVVILVDRFILLTIAVLSVLQLHNAQKTGSCTRFRIQADKAIKFSRFAKEIVQRGVA